MSNIFKSIFIRVRNEGYGASFRFALYRLSEVWHERRLGVHTSPYVLRSELGVDNPLSSDYAPMEYRVLNRILKTIVRQPREGVLLDYGSGMGRVLAVAGRLPLRKIIGVEISDPLNVIAKRNLEGVRHKLRCKDIQILTMDAGDYAVPAEANIFFLFNPFTGPLLARVFDNIRESVERHPRPISLIYIPPAGRQDHGTEHLSWLTKCGEFRCHPHRMVALYKNVAVATEHGGG